MKKPLKLWAFFFIITWILYCLYMRSVAGQCLADQKSLLLELRSSFEFNHSTSTKLSGWNQSTDCCQWHGIDCNSNGSVIGLDVSEEAITSRIDNLSSLFRLKYLQRLNVAHNPFLGSIPSALGNLSSLTYLNVSHTGFMGEVPVEISQLVSLVILDLSITEYGEYPFGVSSLSINNSNLAVIFRNLTQLRELYLGGIDLSAAGNTWGEALSSLPHLQVLSMAYCNLKGGFHQSLVKVRSLSVITLYHNSQLSTPIPEFLASFANLTTLDLLNCSLTGTVPQKVFEIQTLETLELGLNPDLHGTLPSSIGNMKELTYLNLLDCNFQGIIPPSIGSLNQLEFLDLSFNNFSGPIPSFSSAKNLKHISLPYNSLTGSIPVSMFPIDSKLEHLDFGSNQLEGPIPTSLYKLRDLTALALSSNKFDGIIKLKELLTSLQNLSELDLSDSGLSVDTTGINANTSFPQLYFLTLASTNLNILPEFLKDLSYFFWLDLSNNQINGRIPNWIWKDGLVLLNLSCNNFIGMEPPPSQYSANFDVLDLHSNNLQGQLPALPSRTAVEYLDFSNNSFTTSINPDFINGISSALFISLAQNRIYGSIPTSLCNVTGLEVLDLSYNDLNGTIPGCLIEKTQNLAVLNLRGNVIQGAIPDKFPENCTLETLNLNMNFLVGRIPGSLAYCRGLKVMDLGNNRLNDTFPCHFESLSSLQVLILRSNQLHGTVVCPKTSPFLPSLQIIDIAANRFSGQLSTLFLDRWAMAETNRIQSNTSFLQYQANNSAYAYYKDEVSVTFKNYEFQLSKILTIFTSIDLSNNAFRGGLPKELSNLNALKVLNFSHNSLSGNIPGSIGNLSELESLDLSYNALGGSIPQQLASLSFLGYLNLSFNKLEGLIPTSTQLQSFDASSYQGNLRLYGPPLTPPSGKNKPTTSKGSYGSSKREMEWMFSGVAVGFPAGITVFFGPLVCIKKWREWYNYQVDRLLMKVLPSEESQKQNRRRKASRKQKRRN